MLGARLANTYRMSRTPVHEALKTLSKEGLVQVIPRVGYVIPPVTVNDVFEIFQLRLMLETAAIELAAARVTDREIETLRRFYTTRGRRRDADDEARISAVHRDFHLTIASFSGNRRLVDMIAQLLDESQRILSLDPLNLQSAGLVTEASHGSIVKGLAVKKRDRAVDAMASHIRQAQNRITDALLPELHSGRVSLTDTDSRRVRSARKR